MRLWKASAPDSLTRTGGLHLIICRELDPCRCDAERSKPAANYWILSAGVVRSVFQGS